MFTREKSIAAQVAYTATEGVNLTSHHHGKYIDVTYGIGSVIQGVFVINVGQVITVRIEGDDYTKLLSDSLPWSPNKPANTFREEDLLRLIDEIGGGIKWKKESQ